MNYINLYTLLKIKSLFYQIVSYIVSKYDVDAISEKGTYKKKELFQNSQLH